MNSEVAIAAAVVAYFEADGWTVWQEVSLDHKLRRGSVIGNGRADIVVTRDTQIGVVECKGSLSFELLAQAKRWIPFTHMTWIAVPYGKRTVGRDEAFSIAREAGFGILQVRDDEISARGSPRVRLSVNDALLASLRDGHKNAARAGSQAGGHYTSFRETCEKLAAYVAANPGCKLAEAVRAIKHHYASNLGAEDGLERAIKKGLAPGVFVGWRHGLFSTEEEAQRGLPNIGGTA